MSIFRPFLSTFSLLLIYFRPFSNSFKVLIISIHFSSEFCLNSCLKRLLLKGDVILQNRYHYHFNEMSFDSF